MSQDDDRRSLILQDVHVSYQVFEDVNPTLRRFVTNRFKPRSYAAVRAVQGVSLQLERGDALGIIGRNGSGKSTLLRAMAGLLPPTSGRVFTTDIPVLLAVGAALRADLSGRRNVYLGCSALGMSREAIDAAYDDIVAFAGVGSAIERPLKTYSSGMNARIQFSISSAVQPKILLIDEALAVGDMEFRKKSDKRIREMREQAGTVVIVSHGKSLPKMCDRMIWLDDGVVQADGDPEEVTAAYTRAVG